MKLQTKKQKIVIQKAKDIYNEYKEDLTKIEQSKELYIDFEKAFINSIKYYNKYNNEKKLIKLTKFIEKLSACLLTKEIEEDIYYSLDKIEQSMQRIYKQQEKTKNEIDEGKKTKLEANTLKKLMQLDNELTKAKQKTQIAIKHYDNLLQTFRNIKPQKNIDPEILKSLRTQIKKARMNAVYTHKLLKKESKELNKELADYKINQKKIKIMQVAKKRHKQKLLALTAAAAVIILCLALTATVPPLAAPAATVMTATIGATIALLRKDTSELKPNSNEILIGATPSTTLKNVVEAINTWLIPGMKNLWQLRNAKAKNKSLIKKIVNSKKYLNKKRHPQINRQKNIYGNIIQEKKKVKKKKVKKKKNRPTP